MANALSGDTIDLASLVCSRILLTSRAIQVVQDDLEIVGRNRDALTIDGNRSGRVFRHTGAGTLRLRRVSIANGYVTGTQVFGGCIHSLGGVELIGSRLHHCELRAQGSLEPDGFGGGIYANRVLLSYSSAYSNIADGTSDGSGGAVWAALDVVLDHSQVHGNRAVNGGGVRGGSVTATYSVIRGNEARGGGGGGIFVDCDVPIPDCTLAVRKSTVSENRAIVGGGIDAQYRR